MKAIAPIDAPPKRRLPLEPVVESLDDLATALEECSWLESRAATVHAATEQQIRLVKSEGEKQLRVEIDGETVTIAERLKALREAALAWADDHREIVLADTKTKTRKFSHGFLSWRCAADRIDVAEGKTADDVMRAADKHASHEHGFLAGIVASLKRMKLFPGLTAADLFDVKLSVNKRQLLSLQKSGQITAKDLRTLHLVVVDGGETVGLKIAEYHVSAEAA